MRAIIAAALKSGLPTNKPAGTARFTGEGLV